MKDFFYKLSFGSPRSSLTNKEIKIVSDLENLGLIETRKDIIQISQNTVIGTIDLPQNKDSKIAYLTLINKTKEDKDPIINNFDLRGAKNGDIVICKIIGNQRGRKKAKVIYVAELDKPDLIGVAVNEHGKISIKEFFSKANIHTTSRQKSLKTLPKNAVLAVDATTREIKDILGVLDDPNVDEKIVLKRYERREEFSEGAINESKAWGEEVHKELYPNRKDLTHLPFITIDPVTAKDYDDAIYYDKEKNIIYVAIADVTEYVREFTSLDNEAKNRGFTIYFPHKSIPMLPRILSETLCSLNEGVDRLVFTFEIHLSPNGRVERFNLFEGVIRSQRRFTYEEIDSLFDNPKIATKKEGEFLDFLLPLRDLILLLRSKRLAKGYTFRTPDVKIELDKDLKFKESIQEDETISHQLIEECMLLANISAASFFNYGIFRSHPSPDIASINRLEGDLISIGIMPENLSDLHQKIQSIQKQADDLDMREVVDKMIIKSLKRAEYTYENLGHFGLGFERYTHFTSPIRRYSDLILHRYLKAIISKNSKMERYINQQLPFTTKIVTSLEGETTKIAWDYEDLVFARWANENIGNTYTALVMDEGEKGKDTIVKLQDGAFGARVFCRFNKGLRVSNYSTVTVKIEKADLIGVRVYAEILELLS